RARLVCVVVAIEQLESRPLLRERRRRELPIRPELYARRAGLSRPTPSAASESNRSITHTSCSAYAPNHTLPAVDRLARLAQPLEALRPLRVYIALRQAR